MNLRIPGTAVVNAGSSSNTPIDGFVLGWGPQLQPDGVSEKIVFTFLAHGAQTAPAVASGQVLEGLPASCITMSDSASTDATVIATEKV